ncbi:uncharacterized protein LOC132800353 [Ziziphus jujuba]|uniref:Uncharacterized protein LOC132800353 n=1 Tax=Ziziphus jujuba TaxID=326968 RepID=A0ABM3ZZB1_ZIZJJ|nr:uncharacterized protein LOC132800353 [Ziziphus jujuba]
MRLVTRRRINGVHAIKDGQTWLYEPKPIGDYFISPFTELFKSDHPPDSGEIQQLGELCISKSDNALLIRIPSEEEIKEAMLSNLLERIISPNQGAFVRGLWIAENTVVAQEVVYKIRSHKRKNGLMMMEVDLKKAYDRIKWEFLDRALSSWGFSEGFQRLIRSCVYSVHYSLLLNGSICRSFSLDRGLRQADPLSLLLVILCSEFLTRLLTREEKKGTLYGIKISKNAPAVSHLMYAYDLLIMCRAKPQEEAVVDECFKKYY